MNNLNCVMKISLIATTLIFALICNANADSQRAVSNAVVKKVAWGCPPEQMTASALHLYVSHEEPLSKRTAKFAFREIKPYFRDTDPKTELDFLESSYGLRKSIR